MVCCWCVVFVFVSFHVLFNIKKLVCGVLTDKCIACLYTTVQKAFRVLHVGNSLKNYYYNYNELGSKLEKR